MQTNKLSIWTFFSPLKFSLTTFGLLILTTAIYILGLSLIAPNIEPPKSHVTILLLLSFTLGIILQLRKLPRTKMNQHSFVAIHNAQSIILATSILISTIATAYYTPMTLFYIMQFTQRHPILTTIIIAIILLICLYIVGVLLANLYAKILRARTTGIPTWKIIATMPFGFDATWIPGYFLNTNNNKTENILIKSKWYNTLNNWILARKRTLIPAFICTLLVSLFYAGTYSILLVFIFALIFGIWLLQIGIKPFEKNISGTYTNVSIAFNIVMIITFIALMLIQTSTPQIVANQNTATPESIEIITNPQEFDL